MKMVNIMKRDWMLILISLIILLTFSLSGCFESSENKGLVKKEFNGEYLTNENTILIVENVNGDIEITGWSGDKITLDAVKEVDEKYKEQLDDVEINVTEVSEKVVIKAIYNTEKRDVIVTMTIKVPHVVTLDRVSDINGEIKISDVKGDCEVTNTNGLIDINDVDGYIKAKMTNGDIDIRDTTGITDVENTNGNIKTEIYNLKANIEIANTNGDVTVYILPSLDANITLDSENGKVKVHDVDLEYSSNESNSVVGKLGSGTYEVNLITTNGDVNLHKLKV